MIWEINAADKRMERNNLTLSGKTVEIFEERLFRNKQWKSSSLSY